MACTVPQKWPLPSPRSRNQRPPGHGSSFIGIGVPSGISLERPSCSRSAANVASSDARTRISWFTDSERLSIPGRVNVMISPFRSLILLRAAAAAVKASEVVEGRGMEREYNPIWEYVKGKMRWDQRSKTGDERKVLARVAQALFSC